MSAILDISKTQSASCFKCVIAPNIPYWRTSISLAGVGAAQAKAMIAAVAVAIGKNERMLTSLHLREVNAQV